MTAGDIDTVVLDLDGTLVDSVCTHALAWQAAFRDVGLVMPTHRLHGLIGMGGDRLVTAAANETVERAVGDELRTRHRERLDELFWTIQAVDGAVDLLETLRDRGISAVLASSSDSDLTDRLLGLVEGSELLLDRVLTGSDAESSKPDGELIVNALRAVEAEHTLVVGDAIWDMIAARDAGVRCVGVSTGGTPEQALLDTGATAVYQDARSLAQHIRDTGTVLPT